MKKPILIVSIGTLLIISLMLATACMVVMLRDKPTPVSYSEPSPSVVEEAVRTPEPPKAFSTDEKLQLGQKLMKQYLHSEDVETILAEETSASVQNPFGENVQSVSVTIIKEYIEKETNETYVYRAYVNSLIDFSKEIQGTSKNEIYMELKRDGDTYKIKDFAIGSIYS